MNYGNEYKITVDVNYNRGSGKATKPSQGGTSKVNPRKTAPKSRVTQEGSQNYGKNVQTIANMTRNPALAIKSLGRAVPFVGAALVASKIAYEATSFASEMQATLTGDYSFKTSFDNFKGGVSAILNPIGSMMSAVKFEANRYRQNVKQELNRELMGASDLGGEATLKL